MKLEVIAMNYYLDIETSGLDPKHDKIITIQYAPLERNTFKQSGELVILKEWELGGEQELLQKFIQDTPIISSYAFDFIPIGYNLSFEHKFLNSKTKHYKLPVIDIILSRPHIDLHHVGILINHGEHKDSGLDKITKKERPGNKIPIWYANSQYDKIESYIKQETGAFVSFASKLAEIIPPLRSQL